MARGLYARLIAFAKVGAFSIMAKLNGRMFSQYYDETFPSLKDQTSFEESLFTKIRRSNGELINAYTSTSYTSCSR